MRRKPRRCKMDFRVAWVILSLVASVGADAFTFADGASASCVAGGKIVKEVDAEPSQAGLNFTGKTVRISSGFLIIWNAERLKTLPPEVHDYLFFHECAHARVPTTDELKANCAGLQDMRGRGTCRIRRRIEAGRVLWPRQRLLDPHAQMCRRHSDVEASIKVRPTARRSASPY